MVVARLFCRLLLPCLLVGMLPALAQGKDAAGPTGDAREYTVAIIPIMPPAEVKRRWQPALDEVTRLSGLHFRLHFYPDLAHFEQGLSQEEIDFAVGNPVLTWKLRDRYRPLLRGRTPLVAQVVVRRDSPLQQITDLQKHTLGLQEGASLSTNVMVLRILREQKIDFVLHVMNTESSALRSVLVGTTDAALVNNYLLQMVPVDMANHLRVIYSADELPPPALMVSRQTPPEVARKFHDAFLQLRDGAPALMIGILMRDLTDADLDRDYGVMAKLPADASGEHP
ncbi:MAG TPA: PhnD/SsuA/transferrin family substrate-binding protein [Moraxellaceae bacterium]|nr:PhnD/SsuA/transferrin family substrate-binding protein [Moraxellaceae bacterium]